MADTTLVVPLLVPHARSAIAAACWQRDDEWVAPPSLHAEFVNVLNEQLRRGKLSIGDAEAGVRRLPDVVRFVDYEDALVVLRLAMQHRLSGYDAEFAAIAVGRGLRVVTDDVELTERSPNRSAVLMSSFAAGR